jgi:L-ascorbate metabolism protein UlaG (beta-lactamase superfamily)
LIELDGARILTDPLVRPRISALVHRYAHVLDPPPHDIDAVLISHLHHDHLDLPSLTLLGQATRIVTPRQGRALLRRAGFGNVQEVRPGDHLDIDGVQLLTIHAIHLGLRAPLGPWGGCVGFVIGATHRVYFAGDTQAFSAMTSLGPIDVALMPIAGWGPVLGPGHMGPAAAVETLRLIRPRVVIPIHWGSLVPFGLHRRAWSYLTQPPLDFVERMRQHLPNVRVQILQPGESFAF